MFLNQHKNHTQANQGKLTQVDSDDDDELDDIALGRIWTGIGAEKVFLADEVGGLNTAIEIAKEMLEETGSIMIHEYPKIYNTSMDFSFDSNEVVLFPDLLPEALS